MKKRIFIKDWHLLKPYKNHSISDNYYLKLANEVNEVLHTEHKDFLEDYLENKIIDLLAIFLVSYFEDLISETRIFTTFVKKHEDLYGTKLPFYNTDEYYEDEINIQDVQFLTWYFLNTLQKNKLVIPNHPYYELIAKDIMLIFEREYEYAPENPVLKKIYQFPENETDFYKIRKFLELLLYNTYLFKIDTGFEFILIEEDILEEHADDDDMLLHYLNSSKDAFTHSARTKLLALSAKEWAAYILGEQHALHNSLLNISDKIWSTFFYKGQDNNDVFLEHIATNKKFNLTKKSFDNYNDLTEIDNIVHIGIIRWQGEWWFSGLFAQQNFNANLVLDEKNSIQSRMDVNFLDENKADIKKILQTQEDVFKAINKDRQIAFMPTQKVEEFTNHFKTAYNNSLKLSEKKQEEALKRLRKTGFFGGHDTDEISTYNDDSENSVVFFNPNGGMEVAFEVTSAFPSKNNPFYKEEMEGVEVVRLFIEENISSELVKYCINNYQNDLAFLQSKQGEIFKDYTDFLLRFYKKGNYYTNPQITMIGEE